MGESPLRREKMFETRNVCSVHVALRTTSFFSAGSEEQVAKLARAFPWTQCAPVFLLLSCTAGSLIKGIGC